MTLCIISNISARNVTLCSSQHAVHRLRSEFPWSAVHLTDMKGVCITLIESRFFFYLRSLCLLGYGAMIMINQLRTLCRSLLPPTLG